MHYRTEKVSRSRVNVYSVATGEYLCQLTTKEAPAWLARAERNAVEAAANAAEERATRLRLAREYMVRRCLREMAAGVQLRFAF